MRLQAPLLILTLCTSAASNSHAQVAVGRGEVARPAAHGSPISVRWNRLVPTLMDEMAANRRAARAAAVAAGDSTALRRISRTQPPMPFHVYAMLSTAQYAVHDAARRNRAVATDAAVAAASAAVLTSLFPDSLVRVTIARELERDIARAPAGSRAAQRADSSRRFGEEIASRLVAARAAVNVATPWQGTVPTGPGMWYSAPGMPPAGIALATAMPWVLASPSQFRPAPPLTFGSAEFEAALEEVRRVARERTPEQIRIAEHWNAADPSALWNETASAAVRRARLPDAQAARVLSMLNVAAHDAIIACMEAKYHYWSIRPSQADTTLVLAGSVRIPNFPAYPSGHACSAGAFATVLSHFLPQHRAEFMLIANEQAMSRLYAGVHYRFDNDTGLALGRTVARYVLDRDRAQGLNFRVGR